MSFMLTNEQMSELEIFVNNEDPIGYYTKLEEFGDRYAKLALGVVDVSLSSGGIARYYMEKIAERDTNFDGTPKDSVIIDINLWGKISLDLMIEDFSFREQNNLLELHWSDIQRYHESVFEDNGFGIEAWTAYLPLKYASENEKEILWNEMLEADNYLSMIGLGLSFLYNASFSDNSTLNEIAIYSDIAISFVSLDISDLIIPDVFF